jgi:hypothetical protein
VVPPQRFRAVAQQRAYGCKKGLAPERLSQQMAVEVCGVLGEVRVPASDEQDQDRRVVGSKLTSELDSVQTSTSSDCLGGRMLTSVHPTSSQSYLKRRLDHEAVRVFPLRVPQGNAAKLVELMEPELRIQRYP